MVASATRPRSAPLARISSIALRRPSRCCDDSSISTYQGCCAASGSRQSGAVLQHELDALPGHELEAGDAAAGALGGEVKKLERGLRRRHADEGGLDRARARQQPQHRRRDDAERAFGADEQVFQIVAGIVLLQLVEIVEHAAVGQHHFEAEHELARDAIGERAGAARIGRKIAADGAAAFGRRAIAEKAGRRRRRPRARAAG